DLSYTCDDGCKALRFEQNALVAFDVCMLQRPGAGKTYTKAAITKAEQYFGRMTENEKSKLQENIIAGLPGSEESFTLQQFQQSLDTYDDIDASKLQQHLVDFLTPVASLAEELGVKLAIHPDDPPYPI